MMREVFIETAARFPQLKAALAEHFLALTLLPVSIAILIAVPLAIMVRERPFARSLAVGATGIVQTIPSLAMLAFLLPLFGIGKLPAVIALTLYAVLPILQNTIVALRDLPESVLEAADGMGFTKRQRLFQVELPLALPVIVSGIRTATIICVGVATLSTFIGAGGLGDFINRGLSLNRMSLLLIGAGFAAALALMLDFILDTAGQAFQPGKKPPKLIRRWLVSGALLASCTLLILWPTSGRAEHADASGGVVRIASKNFSEQIILGELLAQWIEGRTNLRVERRFNLGGTVICHQALVAGEIDLYVEYSGTSLLTLLGGSHDSSATPTTVRDWVGSEYQRRFGCVVLPPLGFENTYAITVRREEAARNGWETVSDIAPATRHLTAGFTAEFMERADGLPGLSRAYHMDFKQVSDLGPELMYPAIARGDVDVIGAFSTDGRIIEFDLKPLADDREFFPPYEALPVARGEILRRHPPLETVLRELGGLLDNKTMAALNHEVDVAKRNPRDVVRDFLRNHSPKKPTNK